MKYGVYSIQDTLIGFNAPFVMVNDEVAKREYATFLKTQQNAPDMRLFKIGEFDDEKGELLPDVPRMLIGGGDNDGNI